MALYRYLCLAVVLNALLSIVANAQTLNLPKPRSSFDLAHDYHLQLLTLALEKAANGRTLPAINSTVTMVEGRAVRELARGEIIDLYWMGTDKEKEKLLRAIRIPTTKGLIGFRKFLIHKNSHAGFDAITERSALQAKVACQGSDWPDTKILRSQQFTVTQTPNYEDLFAMLAAGRCDYFPRGYHDHQQELSLRADQYPELEKYEGMMLHYPFAVYFFTSKDNESLAQWIEQGLDALHASGEFEAFMRGHPLTASAFPLQQSTDLRWFELHNPFMTLPVHYGTQPYWFRPEDFTATVK